MKQVQHQTLAPQMELSVRILQMDSLQLSDYIKEVMLENPVMEVEQTPPREHSEDLALRKLQWLEEQTQKHKENVGYYDEDGTDFILEKTAAVLDEESLTDHLLRQARLNVGEPGLLATVSCIIGSLDGNGYLDGTEEDLLTEAGCSLEQLKEALAVVQSFDPLGVGARNLGECLALQLGAEEQLAKTLVTSYLEEVAQYGRNNALAKRLGCPPEELDAAVARIRSLNPKPGAAYSLERPPAYISPDVVVTAFENQYHVMLCEFTYPEIRLSPSYLQMAKATDDQEVISYINSKVSQINWIKKCIESRNSTLLSVAKAIVKRQEHFFRYGPQYLNVLRMKDVAEMVELHESTVSRAVRDKYLQCAHGIYPLRHFFVKGVDSADSAGVSSHNIKCTLKTLIEEEDCCKPLSDQRLAERLSAAGMDISRRTVAKYREELGIPNSSDRARRGGHSHSPSHESL